MCAICVLLNEELGSLISVNARLEFRLKDGRGSQEEQPERKRDTELVIIWQKYGGNSIRGGSIE
jgi:hypothetical protein